MNREQLRFLLGDQPHFNVGVAMGSPVRQYYMTGALHALKRRQVAAPRVLEIGSWVGFSAYTWTSAIQRFYGGAGSLVCVDPWDDYAVDNQVHSAAFVGAYRSMLASGLTWDLFSHNLACNGGVVAVTPLRGRSADILPLLRERYFDLVFIDGDHAYGAVRADIEHAARLLAPGGILCGDDLDLEYAQCDAAYAALHRDAQPATDPRTGRLFHPGVTLAVHDTIGPVANYLGFWAVTAGESGFEPLDLEGEPCYIPKHLSAKQSEMVRALLKQHDTRK